MIYIFSAYVLLVLTLSIYFKKKNYFSNYSGDNHQLTTNENNIPLIGGVFLIIPMILLNPSNLILNFFLILIFLIGFFQIKNSNFTKIKIFIATHNNSIKRNIFKFRNNVIKSSFLIIF